ncbi:hypothetical protein F5Y13DRAFT_196191 [Hypoxylon sp. FL1857]|nr:hypothetical protein F5Y13DRAFT_196191 [Hypoxylon sp. FL1857]
MVHKAPNGPSGDSKNTRSRTPDSIVWKGTTARELVSGVRFAWDKYQREIFIEFLKDVGLSFKNADLKPLLKNLNLDGYENIQNRHGQNVSGLIEEKVHRKLKNTADEMGEDVLRKATFGSDVVGSPSSEERSENAPTSNTTSQSNATQASDSLNQDTRTPRHAAGDKTLPPKSSHPFLKMPGAKEPIFPPSPEKIIKREPEAPEPYTFGSSRISSTSQSSAKDKFNFGVSIPPPKFGNRNTTKSPVALSRDTPDANNKDSAKSTRVKKAIERLCSWSKRTETALDEVEAAIGDLRGDEDVRMLVRKISKLRLGLCNLQADVEEMEDYAANTLERR